MKSDATKVAMSNALKGLLKKKKLSKITINDIASECNISRMTFYYHFQDIYDLAEWTLEEAAGRAIGENRTYSSWQQGFEDLLEESGADSERISFHGSGDDRTLLAKKG